MDVFESHQHYDVSVSQFKVNSEILSLLSSTSSSDVAVDLHSFFYSCSVMRNVFCLFVCFFCFLSGACKN